MPAHDPERLKETIPLLTRAAEIMPGWLLFETDDPVRFKREVYWLRTNAESPLVVDGPMCRAVIEWRTSGGGWTADVHTLPIVGDVGRVGRFRFRPSRSNAVAQ